VRDGSVEQGKAFFLVHNGRRGEKVQQIHLAAGRGVRGGISEKWFVKVRRSIPSWS